MYECPDHQKVLVGVSVSLPNNVCWLRQLFPHGKNFHYHPSRVISSPMLSRKTRIQCCASSSGSSRFFCISGYRIRAYLNLFFFCLFHRVTEP